MMKHLGDRQLRRKSQSWVSLLMYRLAQGQVEVKTFSEHLFLIARDRATSAHSVDTHDDNSRTQILLDSMPKNKRLKRKFAHLLMILKQHKMMPEQPANLTIGQLIESWAALTGQDEAEFTSKVRPRIARLVIISCVNNKCVGFTDEQAYKNPEAAFGFIADLYNIFLEETPEEKRSTLCENITQALFTSASPTLGVDNEMLSDASMMVTSETASQIEESLLSDPIAKDRLNQPVFAEVLAMEANKYGWESGVPGDNRGKVRSELSQHGVAVNERRLSRSLKRVARKNPIQIIKDVLSGNLMNSLSKDIVDQINTDSNKTQTQWEFSSETSGNDTEVQKWLFRRD